MIHAREMLEHPIITQMERYGEMVVRRNVGAAIRRPRATNEEQRYACHRQAFRLEDSLRSATRPYRF